MQRLLIATTVSNTLRGFLFPYARRFRRAGWRVDAVAKDLDDASDCAQEFDNVYSVNWSRNPFAPSNFSQPVRRIRELVAANGYDLVHVHTPVASLLTRYALRKRARGRPTVIYTAHGFHFHPNGNGWTNAAFSRIERIASRWTDYLVTINRHDYEAAVARRFLPADRISWMPGIGVDTAYYAPERISEEAKAAVRAELELEPQDCLLLMIAEFNPGKRHADALQALARTKNPRLRLAFAGSGPGFERCRQLARQLGLEDRTRFLGHRKDIRELICASRATLLPSEREGLPRSVMESLSLGAPVIGADARGIRDLLSNGAGLLAPVGDLDRLAAAMDQMANEPETAAEMGRVGRLQMQKYDIQHLIRLHEDLYERAIEEVAGLRIQQARA